MLELKAQSKERPNLIAGGYDAKVCKRWQKNLFIPSPRSWAGNVLRHGSLLYALIMIDDCIMPTAFDSHISVIEFSGDIRAIPCFVIVARREMFFQEVRLVFCLLLFTQNLSF